jgi:hypothetical protein
MMAMAIVGELGVGVPDLQSVHRAYCQLLGPAPAAPAANSQLQLQLQLNSILSSSKQLLTTDNGNGNMRQGSCVL